MRSAVKQPDEEPYEDVEDKRDEQHRREGDVDSGVPGGDSDVAGKVPQPGQCSGPDEKSPNDQHNSTTDQPRAHLFDHLIMMLAPVRTRMLWRVGLLWLPDGERWFDQRAPVLSCLSC